MCTHVLSDILRKYEDIHENVIPRLVNCYDVMSSPKGKAALVWIMGEYGEVSCMCDYRLVHSDVHSFVYSDVYSDVYSVLYSVLLYNGKVWRGQLYEISIYVYSIQCNM